jgi:CcmD family protein
MKFFTLILFLVMTFFLQTAPASSPTKNLNFLFAAYAVVWALIIAYVFSLSRRQKKLAEEIEAVKQMQSEAKNK